MRNLKLMRALLPVTLAAATALIAPAPATAQTVLPRPSEDVTLSVGAGKMVRLPSGMTDFFIANPAVADVQIESSTQLYIFGKGAGETTVYATNGAGRVVYAANVRVAQNIDSVGDMLRAAMPESNIQVTTMNGAVLLTGTVASPLDVEDATRLSEAFLGEGTKVISRIKTATPMQVMLKVTIAEVSRSLTKNIGFNINTRDQSGGLLAGIVRGRAAGTITDKVSNTLIDEATGNPLVIGTNYTFNNTAGNSAINLAGRLFGVDAMGSLDLNETSGLVSVLAEPTLTALSGETASFLAGGEFPVPIAEGINGTSIEFKEYGVSLAFTPTVLEGGRISMRVRPEVSELTSDGAIVLNSFEIPGISTRRTETTVELGSGQSLVLAGLMRNNSNNAFERTPGLGNLPVIGALFRSSGFRRNQTELVVVVTPYLVRPINASQISLPTDGYRTANDGQRVLLDQEHDSQSGERRPVPSAAQSQTVAPGFQTQTSSVGAATRSSGAQAPRPGFGF